MSWNINVTGTDKDAIKASINAEAHLPQQLKDLFASQMDRMKANADFGIAVRSTGSHDEHYCYGDFKVERTRLV
jgi:hypothetical protein